MRRVAGSRHKQCFFARLWHLVRRAEKGREEWRKGGQDGDPSVWRAAYSWDENSFSIG
jgi:hypothetical protein